MSGNQTQRLCNNYKEIFVKQPLSLNWLRARAIPRHQLINKWVVSPPPLSTGSSGAGDKVSPGPDHWSALRGRVEMQTGFAGNILLFSVEKV